MRNQAEGNLSRSIGTKEASRGIDYDETFGRNAESIVLHAFCIRSLLS